MIDFRKLIIGAIYLTIVAIICVDYNASYVTNETTLLNNTTLEPQEYIQEQEPSEFEFLKESCSIYESYENWYCMSEIPKEGWFYVDYIVFTESSYDMFAVNEETGATGLCQLNPNWHEIPANYYLSAINQLNWCDNYMAERYGSWEEAYNFHINNGWW